MAEISQLTWTPRHDDTYHVASPWWELVWHPTQGLTQLCFGPNAQPIPAVLGLTRVTTQSDNWDLSEEPPADAFVQDNRVTASWPATDTRPVEIHARWILEPCRFWLEISLLTPMRLQELAIYPQSRLGSCLRHSCPDLHPEVFALLAFPRAVPEWAYLQLAPRTDTFTSHLEPDGTVRFGLFQEDLEKGVVLRTRLLATFLRVAQADVLAPEIARTFAQAPPDLSR
ncbi:MAG: hypothetical protein RMI91_03095 [Gemmatales bacterium]|nr:hypothetical protein [Gemmatales bacterium]MDW7993616.1 hypothetical protein [Gemmatales bacterium]